MLRRLCLLLSAALAAFAASAVRPGDADELDFDPLMFDPVKLEFMIMRGQADEAIEEANQVLARLRRSDDPLALHQIGEVLTYLCEARGELAQYRRAEAACLEAIATLDQLPDFGGLEKEAQTRAQAMLAYVYERAGELRAAIDARRRQIDLAEDGPKTADYRSDLLVRIAGLHQTIGEWKQAEPIYREALALTSQIPEEDRWLGLSAWRSVAMFYLLQERFDEAEALLGAALAEAKRLPNTRDWQIIGLCEAMGWTYFHQGRYNDARAAAQAALEYHQQNGQVRTLEAAEATILMARVKSAEVPDSPEAERLLTAVLELPDDEADPDNSQFKKSLARTALAGHHLAAGKFAEAELLARQAAAGFAEGMGDQALATASTYEIIALALQGQDKLSDAVEFAQESYAIEQQTLPPYHSEIGETLALLTELYESLEQRENLAAVEQLLVIYRSERIRFEEAN